MLNDLFLEELKELIPNEYEEFLNSYKFPPFKALRINTLKTTYDEIIKEIELGSVTSFDANTFYLDSDYKLGNHPYHIGGLYYLQEPSATMVVNALDVKQGDRVLDLCAAPGGKSTQILSLLNGTGLLWSNEINMIRAQSLLSNLERWGCDNYILTNMSTDELCPKLIGCFDKVLVDAPCSGASMFKRFPESINDYTKANIAACQNRQLKILEEAYKTLKKDGILVYSTCTFNTKENEEVVEQFLKKHPGVELVSTGLACGRGGMNNNLVRRCYPMDGGEGHFVAKMIRREENQQITLSELRWDKNKIVDEFVNENMKERMNYCLIGDHVYVSKKPLINFKGKIVRQGVLLGTIQKQRLEPHQNAFVAIMNQNNFKQIVELSQEATESYLKGNTLPFKNVKGYVQLTYKNHPFAFGKADGRQIKNKLPKGLRKV